MFSPGLCCNFPEKSESWIQRVVENLRLALHAVKVRPSAAAF
jgi:hypothetical protein